MIKISGRVCIILAAVTLFLSSPVWGQSKSNPVDKFRQLEEILPTPNVYRTASGAPGPEYWQQRADYKMDLILDDERQTLTGKARITYTNQSPDTLRYLWLQLDQNRFDPQSDGNLAMPAPDFEDEYSFRALNRELARRSFDGGYKISEVSDGGGNALPHTIVKTMLRIDLPTPLPPGEQTVFNIGWKYNIPGQKIMGGRAGYEYFEKDGNYLYEIAQFFPRMAAYTDVNGWQNKQFLGDGEFSLEFGDYVVSITAPADHIVTATGELQNPEDVLTATQRERLNRARTAEKPVFVVTEEEAKAAESNKAQDTKTWIFAAKEVRDFAFASSRKFIWDAQGHKQPDGSLVMAMSLYPKEGNPLWERYSTEAIIHTLEEYRKYSFIYPYPVAISVNGPVGGMEYPMICFNGPRPAEDGTYTPRNKYGLISVIIHEVGHNFFPMIVNSDERQWTWMDEGINSFLQFLAEQSWEENYPSRRGEPYRIVDYMISEDQLPIMTNSESILQFGNNAYGKPATALNIMRETILGRELFDFAFREYSLRWKFKRPMPADFFRTMEDASGVDLDWFWRGWFYSTDHVDISIEDLRRFKVSSADPDVENPMSREEDKVDSISISDIRNKETPTRVDAKPELSDFYNEHDKFTVTEADRREYKQLLERLDGWERELLKSKKNFYIATFENIGGLVMPIILEVSYVDGAKELIRIPAEIWRYNHRRVEKLLVTDREIASLRIDPYQETADANVENNHHPRKPVTTRFQLYKKAKEKNMMQKMQETPGSTGQSGNR